MRTLESGELRVVVALGGHEVGPARASDREGHVTHRTGCALSGRGNRPQPRLSHQSSRVRRGR